MASKTKKTEEPKAKKTAKKAAKVLEAAPKSASPFNLLNNPQGLADATGAAMKALLEKRKGREVNFSSQAELQIDTLPVRSLYFQWMINNRRITKGTTNFVAKDKLGKSSLCYYLFGGFISENIPCGVLVCEQKPLSPAWSARCLTADRNMVHLYGQAVHVMDVHLLEEMAETVETWCKVLRDPSGHGFVPMSVPVVLAMDPLNRLATNAQAAGISLFAGNEKKDKVEIADHGHMWDRSKWLHDFVTRILLFQEKYNLHLIPIEHQNEDGPGGGGGKVMSFIPQSTKELNHRTKPGGQAINQVANLQLTFADKGGIYSAGTKVARRIVIRPYKNSYGTDVRTCCFALKSDPYSDTDNFLDPGVRFDYTEVEWLAENGWLGFRKTGATLAQERFSSSVLNFTQLSLVEAAQAWREANPAVVEQLGRELEIPGYIDVYGRIIKELKGEDHEG